MKDGYYRIKEFAKMADEFGTCKRVGDIDISPRFTLHMENLLPEDRTIYVANGVTKSLGNDQFYITSQMVEEYIGETLSSDSSSNPIPESNPSDIQETLDLKEFPFKVKDLLCLTLDKLHEEEEKMEIILRLQELWEKIN